MRHIPQWLCNFDVDRYINPFIPPSQLWKFPKPVARFLGYRDSSRGHVCNPLTWLWTFVGSFCGVAIVEGVFRSSSAIQALHPPVIIGSFGAAAILEYNSIESPLAQPRGLILSHILSAAIGVGITKLFALLPPPRFQDLKWLAGALSVAVSSVVMSITKTIHPPAGATALLAATSPDVTALGWWLLPLMLLGSVLMLGVALVTNNIQRQFPMFWWTPVDLRKKNDTDIEQKPQKKQQTEGPRASADKTSSTEITITADGVSVPSWFQVDAWEKSALEVLRLRIAEGLSESSSHGSFEQEK